jgi:hypothetical protein
MKDTEDLDRAWLDEVVDAVRKAPNKHPPRTSMLNRVRLWIEGGTLDRRI